MSQQSKEKAEDVAQQRHDDNKRGNETSHGERQHGVTGPSTDE